MSSTVETIIIVCGTLMRPCRRKGARHRNIYSIDWAAKHSGRHAESAGI